MRNKASWAIGVVAGALAAAAVAWAIVDASRPPEAPEPAPVAEAPSAASAPPRGFSPVSGPAPGPETPYSGELVAYARWSDDRGGHVVTLAEAASTLRPDFAPDPEATLGDAVAATLEARHYLSGASGYELVSERVESTVPGASAAFYKDGVWADDFDGDGLGEALFAYHVDESPGPGARRLALAVFSGAGELTMTGGTRYDPEDGPGIPPSTRLSESLAGAPEAIRSAAARLWDEAQFDLAEPPAFPGFFEHRRYADASFRGDEPFWALTLLPQYMSLKTYGDDAPAIIRYESVRAEGSGLVIEGRGEMEAWSHGFRVTIAEGPVRAPDGRSYPLVATVDWSEGARLSGWGSLAEQDAP